MAVAQSTPSARPPSGGDANGVTWIIENDYRRSSIGMHVGSDRTKPANLSTSIWVDHALADAIARALLDAASRQREHEQAVAWTVTTGGRHHG